MKLRAQVGKVILLMIASSLATACQSKPAASAGMLSSPPTRVAQNVANDYSKRYLTDQKVQQFLASMKEEHNPLELVFKQGGGMQDLSTMASRIDEFNSFARKYGLQDYQDYTGVWGRITVGEMQIWGAKTFEDMISGAQAELKKPDLVPEMRKVYEDQIATAQKGLDDMSKKSSSVNAADVELIKKYKDQVDAAQKKYAAAK
jgi:hypothetical protein